MKHLIIKRKNFQDFYKQSLMDFINVSNINTLLSEKLEINENMHPIEDETYMIGIDENGDLIYTESSVYIEFSNAVFFEIFDDETISNLPDDIDNYEISKYQYSYFKKIIEAKFKNKNIDIEIDFQ